MHIKSCFQQGLLAAVVISLVACGGGGGGNTKSSASSSVPASSVVPSSAPASSVVPSSTPASSVVPSSTSASSVAPGSALASTVASSSVVSSAAQSSSNSSIVSRVTTTFNVSISPPQLDENASQTKTGRSAVAQKTSEETLPLNQLAVVIVDVSGEVQETIPLEEGKNAWQNDDGTWTLKLPGYRRLDLVVVANLDDPITLVKGASLFDVYPDALLSPTTSDNLEVNLAATAAYQNLLNDLGGEGTFASLNVDVNDPAQLSVIQNLIETIAEMLDSEPYIGATSIAEALDAVQEQVTAIVQVEVKNIQNQVDATVNTVAKGVEAGGVFSLYGAESNIIHYSGFTALNVPEQELMNEGSGFVPEDDDNWRTMVLTSSGWVVTSDVLAVSSLNQDGSITLSNTEAKVDSTNVKASQVINLSGRNIANFFSASSDTRGITSEIDPASTFAEGSLAYRTNLTATNESYVLWYDPGYDSDTNDSTDAPLCFGDIDGDHLPDPVSEFGGNCQTPSAYTWTADQTERKDVSNMTSLDQLLSADVAPGTVGAKLILINGVGVQLVNDANKTVRYFRLPNWGFDSPTLIGTGTWAEQDLPNLTVDAAAIIVAVPPRIAKYEFDADEQHIFFTKQNGLIRRGNRTSEGMLVETGFLLLNHTAKDGVMEAFDY